MTKYAHSLGAILKSAITHEGKEDLRNEAKVLILHNSMSMEAPTGSKSDIFLTGMVVTSTHDALKALLMCDYVQKLLKNSRVIRQDSLLRMTGASPSAIGRAQLEMLEEDEAEAAANETRRNLNCGNCGNCFTDGILTSWIPTREGVRGIFLWNKKDMELHVQD